MAPPKTMVISQQQQQTQQAACRGPVPDQSKQTIVTAKQRKRKTKQPQQTTPAPQASVEKQQVPKDTVKPNSNIDNGKESLVVAETVPVNKISESKQAATNAIVPSERASTIKKQQQQQQQPQSQKQNQVPTPVKRELNQDKRKPVEAATVLGKQLSEDTDDIDAGIELDGSSNSGSSVKDMSEDPSKSVSVSPVMAQSNLVNENRDTKHAAEVASVEQLTGSMCTDMAPSSKKAGATKQQLAANQQVIDADEQQLQQKLQDKQRKLSIQYPSNSSTSGANNNGNVNTPQSPALCKICEQHVYQMERMLAEKSVYHKKCFRCFQCKIQLRVDNYSSHEGQVYCKAHHRQLFQPQAKLDSGDDVDIVAKSTSKPVDEYLLHRGRLTELSLSLFRQDSEGVRQRQMLICENEPAELPKDVVRSDTKVDDGFEQLNLNLSNIKERFERGSTDNGDESKPSSAGIVIEKPSFNIKQTLKAFESRMDNQTSEENSDVKRTTERPIVKKLTNLNGFLDRQNSIDKDVEVAPVKPLSVRRSESLMMRLKKYESRIAGEQVDDDDGEDEEGNNDDQNLNDKEGEIASGRRSSKTYVPKKLSSIDLSSLKNQWENGDINKRRYDDDDETNGSGDINCNDNSPSAEKNEELYRIRQQLARKKLGESGNVRNIYENAIKEAQLQQKQQASSRRDSSDLRALNGFSTSEIQQQLMQNGSNSSKDVKTPVTPNKDHFQLNLSNKANKLKEKFELGLINNDSRDDSDQEDGDETPAMSKLEQIRQEKLEDLSIFTEGEIKAREARSLFQQIDRRLSAGSSVKQPVVNSRSLASINASSRTKLAHHNNGIDSAVKATSSNNSVDKNHPCQKYEQSISDNQPIRLTNNVRT